MPKLPSDPSRRRPAARTLRTSGDPGTSGDATLDIGEIADGEYLRRSGDTIVGDAGSGGGGGGAPDDAQYVTLATDGGLSDERVLAVGSGLQLTDGGAGSTVTIAPDDDLAALEALSGGGFARRTGTSAWDLRSASQVVDAGLAAPPRIAWGDSAGDSVEYLANANGGGTTAGAPPANQIWYLLHVEDQVSATYDALLFGRANAVANSLYRVALYEDSGGAPGALLWDGNGDIATDAAGVYTTTFAAGAWDASGASYRDGSDRLVLTRGQCVWRAIWRANVGSPTLRAIPVGVQRVLGVNTAGNWGGYTHWEEAATFSGGSWPDPAGSTASLGGQGDLTPYLPLRWV